MPLKSLLTSSEAPSPSQPRATKFGGASQSRSGTPRRDNMMDSDGRVGSTTFHFPNNGSSCFASTQVSTAESASSYSFSFNTSFRSGLCHKVP
jgi:hypothetical protein